MALGMSRAQALRRVIVPQALRRVLPVLASTWVSLFKDTSLVSVIAVTELAYVAMQVRAQTFRVLEMLTAMAAIYWLLGYPQAKLVDWIQRRYRSPNERGAPNAMTTPQSAAPRAKGGDCQDHPLSRRDQALRLVHGAERRRSRRPRGRSRVPDRPVRARESRRSFAARTASRRSTAARSSSKARCCRRTSERCAAMRARMGMVFQSFELFPHLTAQQNVAEGPRTVQKVSLAEANRRAVGDAREGGARRQGGRTIRRRSPADSSSASRSPALLRWSRT